MTLDEFLKEARTNINEFEKMYRRNHENNPSQYPIDFDAENSGFWWEMLYDFDED